MTKNERCTGHCCKKFTLNVSHEQLWLWANKRNPNPEIVKIADMIIPLGRGGMRGVIRDDAEGTYKLDERDDGDDAPETFTCRHLDDASNCGIYETRPEMCSEFPGKKKSCNYKGCTSSCAATKG